MVQISVFDEQKQLDDAMMVTEDGLDLNDHKQVFRVVFDQVRCRRLDTKKAILVLFEFKNILDMLIRRKWLSLFLSESVLYSLFTLRIEVFDFPMIQVLQTCNVNKH